MNGGARKAPIEVHAEIVAQRYQTDTTPGFRIFGRQFPLISSSCSRAANFMSLEQQASDRKARLQQLKAQKNAPGNRNHDPELLAAIKGSLRPAVLQEPTAEDYGKRAERDILAEFDRRARRTVEAAQTDEYEFPTKDPHDQHLKKALDPYTREAEARTQRAVFELVREKMRTETGAISEV